MSLESVASMDCREVMELTRLFTEGHCYCHAHGVGKPSYQQPNLCLPGMRRWYVVLAFGLWRYQFW